MTFFFFPGASEEANEARGFAAVSSDTPFRKELRRDVAPAPPRTNLLPLLVLNGLVPEEECGDESSDDS